MFPFCFSLGNTLTRKRADLSLFTTKEKGGGKSACLCLCRSLSPASLSLSCLSLSPASLSLSRLFPSEYFDCGLSFLVCGGLVVVLLSKIVEWKKMKNATRGKAFFMKLFLSLNRVGNAQLALHVAKNFPSLVSLSLCEFVFLEISLSLSDVSLSPNKQ